MSGLRIKGQEVQVLVVTADVLEDTFTAIKNFESTAQLAIKSEGYLGEKFERKDNIYNGMKGSFELHVQTARYWSFRKAVIEKAQRITPDTVFNISGVFFLPDGTTISDTLVDVQFGELPTNVSSRADYVSVKVTFECEASIFNKV